MVSGRICTYADGLRIVIQNQLLPSSGKVIVRTRATLARLMQVQKVSRAACPLLGTIVPSNLDRQHKQQLKSKTTAISYNYCEGEDWKGRGRDSRDGLASIGDDKVVASEERKNLPGDPAWGPLLLSFTYECPLHYLGLDRALYEGPQTGDRNHKEAQGGVIASQRVTRRSICQQ